MPQAPQSVKLSVFIPYIKAQVATALSLQPDFVRVVAKDTDTWPAMATEPLSATIWFSPPRPQPNSGAGRYAYMIDRTVRISVWSRHGVDSLGSDEKALMGVYDIEDQLVTSLLLVIPANTDIVNPYRPLKYLESSDANRLYKVDASKYRCTLDFLLSYSAPVTVGE